MEASRSARVQRYADVDMEQFVSQLPARGPGRPSKARQQEERVERAEWRAARGGDPRPTPSPEPVARKPRKSLQNNWSTPRPYSPPMSRPLLAPSRSTSSMIAPITYAPRSPEGRPLPLPLSGVGPLSLPAPPAPGHVLPPSALAPPAPPPGAGVPGNPRMMPILQPITLPPLKTAYKAPRRPYNETGYMHSLPSRSASLSVCRYILQRLRQLKAHADGRVLTDVLEKLPDPEKEPRYYDIIQKPTCLADITERVETFKPNTEPPFSVAEPSQPDYPTASEFHMDMDLMFSNALKYHQFGTRAYYDVSTVQRVFQQMARCAAWVDDKFTEGAVDLMLALAPKGAACAYNSIDFGPAVGTEDNDLILSRAGQKKDHHYFEYTWYQGRKINRGDWVHVFNPTNPSLPIVGHVFRIATALGGALSHQITLSICWYYRPEQTIHPPSMTFWANEVAKSSCVVEHNLEDVMGSCLTMYYARYQRQRPLLEFWDREAPFYLVEHRYTERLREDKEKSEGRDKSERDRHFVKIKNWLSCMPEDQRAIESSQVNAFIFAPPEPPLPLPPKMQSPLVRGVKGPGMLCREPTPEMVPVRPVADESMLSASSARRTRYDESKSASHHHSSGQASQQNIVPSSLTPAQIFRHVYNTVGVAQLKSLAVALHGPMIDYVSVAVKFGLQPQILVQFHAILDAATETGNVAAALGNLLAATGGAGSNASAGQDLSLGLNLDAGALAAVDAGASSSTRPSTRLEPPSVYSAITALSASTSATIPGHPPSPSSTALSTAPFLQVPEATRSLFLRDASSDKVLWFAGAPRTPQDQSEEVEESLSTVAMARKLSKHSLEYLYQRALADKQEGPRRQKKARRSVRFDGIDVDGDVGMRVDESSQVGQSAGDAEAELKRRLTDLTQGVNVESIDLETNRYWANAAEHLSSFLQVDAR